MTPEQIQRLRGLEAKATEGPWKPTDGDLWFNDKHNQRLIAEMRNALPSLLDDWERMRRQLAEIESGIKQQLEQAQESLRRRPDSVFFEGVYQASEAAAGWIEDAAEDSTLDDDFGNVWAKCERADCQLQIVRPGKAQCPRCEEEGR